MAIGIPTSIGSATANTSVSSLTITTTAAIVSGNWVGVAIAIKGSSNPTVSTISDGTNSYIPGAVVSSVNGSADRCEFWYKENAAAVAGSASLLITLTGVLGATPHGISAAGVQVTGLLSSGSFDSVADASNSTSSASSLTVNTGTLAITNEIIFGVLCMGTGSAYTESANFNNLFSDLNGTNNGALSLGYDIVSVQSPVAYSPSVVTLSGLAGLAVPFIGAPIPPSLVFQGQTLVMPVTGTVLIS